MSQLLLTIRRQDLTGLLESLVGKMLKWEIACAADGQTTTSGTNWHFSRFHQLFLEFGQHRIGVEVCIARRGGLSIGLCSTDGGRGERADNAVALRPQLPSKRPYDGLAARHDVQRSVGAVGTEWTGVTLVIDLEIS